MKRRVIVACRLHHPWYGNQPAVGVSSRRGENSLLRQCRHVGAAL